MRTISGIVILVLLLSSMACLASGPLPGQMNRNLTRASETESLTGDVVQAGKARSDTLYLMGGPDRGDGNFQDEIFEAFPDPEGWIGVDLTQRTEVIWHIDDFNAELLDESISPNRAMWCGEYYEPCGGEPENPGYGNNYNEYLDWYGIVPNNLTSTNVRVTARLNYDNEPGYDFLYLKVERASGMEAVQTYNGDNRVGGVFVPVDVDVSFTVNPGDYVGGGQDQVHLRWHFESDGGWSDQDCLWVTDGAGQVDNITILFDDVPWAYDDFEPGSWVNWTVSFPPGVGQFAWPWPYLEDIDACRVNFSPQWGFIDNGLVQPGTGGSTCITWCYGPGGYILNANGGLAGSGSYLTNEIWSPALAWPDTGSFDGAMYSFNVYRHEPLDSPASAGMLYVWHVRSTADPTGNSGWSGWVDRNFVYYGGPDYIRHNQPVTDLLVSGRKFVQLAFGIWDYGHWWGYGGLDASPAPYFDNASFRVYRFPGPAISTREIDLAQDNFPENGAINGVDLAANHVRFDMAMNIAAPGEPRNLPGDSICFDITAVRTGSVLNGSPEMCYRLRPNPLFDSVRSGFPNAGCTPGDSARTSAGIALADRWCFDLPDTAFFFPGDVIHYYVRAQDNVSGDIATSRLPGDTTGFSSFPGDAGHNPLLFPSTFTVRALPSLTSLPAAEQPSILFWNDFGARGGESYWYTSFNDLGFQAGVDYDVYHTNGPSSAVGNGLGGRATSTQLAGYETIIYTCGDLSEFTISNGDYMQDAGNDVGVLDGWLDLGDKQMLLTGDDLAYDLSLSGAATLAFLSNRISVDLVSRNLEPLIDGQATPTVTALPGNNVFYSVTQWFAHGGCPILNTFDAVHPIGNAVSLAEFEEPPPEGGKAYTYAAAVSYVDSTVNNRVIFLPYDFMFISSWHPSYNDGKAPAMSADRTRMLEDILLALGYNSPGGAVPVPDFGQFSVRNYPNPFNPSTRIEYNMPRAGELSIKIYNVRGELVRVLVDDIVEAGPGLVIWDGSDAAGEATASGVYFYETRALGKAPQVKKMVMVK